MCGGGQGWYTKRCGWCVLTKCILTVSASTMCKQRRAAAAVAVTFTPAAVTLTATASTAAVTRTATAVTPAAAPPPHLHAVVGAHKYGLCHTIQHMQLYRAGHTKGGTRKGKTHKGQDTRRAAHTHKPHLPTVVVLACCHNHCAASPTGQAHTQKHTGTLQHTDTPALTCCPLPRHTHAS